jgi:hypothetical protein
MPVKIVEATEIPLGPQVSRLDEFKEAVITLQKQELKKGRAIEITMPKSMNKRPSIVAFVRAMKGWLASHQMEQYRVAIRKEKVYITNAGRKHVAQAEEAA